MELSFLAAKEYLRMFWWYVAIVPLFGLIAVLFADGALKMIGYVAILWPLTIPSRAFLTSSKSSRLFSKPLFMEADDESVRFYSVATDPKRLRFLIPADQIRDTADRGDLLVLRTRRFGVAPISKKAFATPEEMEAFRSLIERVVQARLASVPDV